ncbi:hypothetical protein UXO91_14845, partial [Enterobacter hormaechei]
MILIGSDNCENGSVLQVFLEPVKQGLEVRRQFWKSLLRNFGSVKLKSFIYQHNQCLTGYI